MGRLSHDYARQQKSLNLERRGGTTFNGAGISTFSGWQYLKARVLFERSTRVDARRGAGIGSFYRDAASCETDPYRQYRFHCLAKHFFKKAARKHKWPALLANLAEEYCQLASMQKSGRRECHYQQKAEYFRQAAQSYAARGADSGAYWPPALPSSSPGPAETVPEPPPADMPEGFFPAGTIPAQPAGTPEG